MDIAGTWSLGVAVAVFVACTLVIAVAGTRLARTVDTLADRTGIGEAIAGAVVLGAATSLSGLVVSVVAAADGDASLAVTNSVGGIAAQTAFIVGADVAYRRVNLEHAAASLTNIFSAVLLVFLLAIILMGASAPQATVLGLHPASIFLVAAYVYGLRLARDVGEQRMWEPRQTEETVEDEPDEDAAPQHSTGDLWIRFAVFAGVIAAAGWGVGQSGLVIIAATGLTSTVVGTFFTSIVTSLPELVTAVAAVRAGALTLAIGGIIGGNAFDTIFVAIGDGVYQEGSIYSAITGADLFVVSWTIGLVALATAGLLIRERRGVGFEGVAILGLYAAGAVVLALL